jgi:hypothetical protein
MSMSSSGHPPIYQESAGTALDLLTGGGRADGLDAVSWTTTGFLALDAANKVTQLAARGQRVRASQRGLRIENGAGMRLEVVSTRNDGIVVNLHHLEVDNVWRPAATLVGAEHTGQLLESMAQIRAKQRRERGTGAPGATPRRPKAARPAELTRASQPLAVQTSQRAFAAFCGIGPA